MSRKTTKKRKKQPSQSLFFWKKKKNFFDKEQSNQSYSQIPFRLNFLFFIVFILFVSLIIRLSYLQITNHNFFVTKIETSQKNVVQGNAPRGMIYDEKGKVLVNNKGNQAIIYTKKVGTTNEEMLSISKKLTSILTIEPEELTERDRKDFWLADPSHYKEAKARLSPKQLKNKKGEELSGGELYQQVVNQVSAEEATLTEDQLKEATIYKKINGAYSLTPVFIKNKEVTPEEIAIVGENKKALPGVSTGMDWERDYPAGDSLRSILGTVSSEKMGLPESHVKEFLAQGYARNDRVGLSYLEQAYEPVLRGTKSQTEYTINRQSEIDEQKEVYAGEKGKNLVLTLDIDFQKKVEDILRKNYQVLLNNGKARYAEGAYVVVTNPKNGEVYALVGLKKDGAGGLEDDTLGTITKTFVPGSAIKGATVMAGLENGVISGNQVMVDEPIQIAGSNVKRSLFNPSSAVPLSATQALMISSNVYMMKIAMSLMDVTYQYGMSLPDRTDVFDTLRKTYQNFGLGTYTGIDLPGEELGLSPSNHYDKKGNLKDGRMANLLDLSYGNYDTYTPIQMAQYISTIANGGKRIAPHVVRSIHGTSDNGGLGPVETYVEPKVLSEIGTKGEWDIIHQGLYDVVNSPDYRRTGAMLQGGKYVTAAKTGTAETFVPNESDPKNPIPTINSTMVAYAPYDNPEVTVTVVLPHLMDDQDKLNSIITKEVLDAYHDFRH